ncbi:MAG: hypothetical protein O7B25_15520, partial [Gammaproteobacteria bacterium]|nr:hypothetical protein [Gammaproteobacteria bacterium]
MKYFAAVCALAVIASCATDPETIRPRLSETAPQAGIQDDFVIRQSPNDDRNYRYFILENELRVLVVSDPETDKAAASLVVLRG